MAEPPDSELKGVLPDIEEVGQLNRTAVVVYAARSALRALVLVRFAKGGDAFHLEAAFRAVQAAIAACMARNTPEARRHAVSAAAAVETIAAREHADLIATEAVAARAAAALAAASSVPFDPAYAAEALAARVADATVNAIASVAYAARVAGGRAVDTAAAVTAAAYAARAGVDVTARATGRDAARADYEMLLAARPASLVPQFFKNPLWPGADPAWWEQARRKWHEAIDGAGLGPLGKQYEDWLQGEFDSDQMLREVEEWNGRYAQLQAGDTPRTRRRSGKTAPPIESTPKVQTNPTRPPRRRGSSGSGKPFKVD